MPRRYALRGALAAAACLLSLSAIAQVTAAPVKARQTSRPAHPDAPFVPTASDLLLGAYGTDRANNDLLSYHLDIRVDPEKQYLSGSNTIRFRMLTDGTRIQIDLTHDLHVDRILFAGTALPFNRKERAVLIDFPKTLRKGKTYEIQFFYSGNPVSTGRFGTITFGHDPAGRTWVNTACEETGASSWWPNKDQWRDEPQDGMLISVAVPNGLMDVSNGRFVRSVDLHDGYTRWDWKVHYPINNYDVSLNIGDYRHWDDRLGSLTLDFYALPEDLEKAKKQFAQARPMIEAYQHYFGKYPFGKDGYKLVQVPYSGMEHQSAVTYGNHFTNGYLGRDWTGVGISPRFDFIIIHESGHEWFGNAVSAADRSDMWIHEGWTTYLEALYVEYVYGHADYLRYINAYKNKVHNQQPIIAAHDVNATPPQDMYFKGALMIHTLRSVVDDDRKWFKLQHKLFQHFKYHNVMTEEIVNWFNTQTGMNLTPIFDEYLRHVAIPCLELRFNETAHTVQYRWRADEAGFAMPIKVGDPEDWTTITPTTAAWQTMKTSRSKEDFAVATDLYYVDVMRSDAANE